jgi:hypothetical protein
MDVLAYSAFNQQITLNQQIVDKTSCLATKCSETTALQATAAGFSASTVCWLQCIEPCLLREPFRSSYWTCIPNLEGASTGFKVCDTSAQFNCGACCQWTVPDGATRARFQIWGAGGGSGAGHCCGGSPYGATGAYASVIIPVTPGDTYTLCAGCAYCCFPSRRSQGRVPGCPSYVTGNGLNNFCANGGQGRLGNWMAALGKSNTQRLAAPNCDISGPCFCCFGSHYCFTNSCATCGVVPFTAGASYFGTTTFTSSPSIVYGIRGMWPSICFDTNHYGSQCHSPIYGFPSSSCCSFSWSSGTCCGYAWRAAVGYLQVPGAGGWATIGMGGNYATCGDMGRMGMVCVTYC